MSKRKHFVIELILLIVILVLNASCTSMYWTYKKQKGELVRENQAKWTMIYEMTQEIETYFVRSDDWTKVEQFWVYVRGITHYDGMDTLEPQFSGMFLTQYDQLFSSLCVDDEYIKGYEEEGFRIFSNMNRELKQISKSVLEKIEHGENFMNPKSEEYKETTKELQELCEKYEKILNEYYEKIDYGA